MADADKATGWTRGPAKWAAVGFLGGASLLGLVWSMSSRVESPWADGAPIAPGPPASPPGEGAPPAPAGLVGVPPVAAPREPKASVPPLAATQGLDPGRKININTASAAELELLPDVGPTLARAIIEHRRKHGPFRSVEGLDEVSGIGPKRLERLRPLVVVE